MKQKEAAVTSRIQLSSVTIVEETWQNAARVIEEAARSELDVTKPGRSRTEKQPWLWTDEVMLKVREKRLYLALLYN
ncbi:hypothetical protein Y032_0058g2847 [Ancylostoma ceylanicum]|uniref:Uncharacterized protein n=1 Tax=Ancylostoma ceylanicum TaxID=53326 RepID=A0A016U3G1_9BILA|nr:hypothetical protein Y032_0058g2847 [Ancylostoma ceylanicum]